MKLKSNSNGLSSHVQGDVWVFYCINYTELAFIFNGFCQNNAHVNKQFNHFTSKAFQYLMQNTLRAAESYPESCRSKTNQMLLPYNPFISSFCSTDALAAEWFSRQWKELHQSSFKNISYLEQRFRIISWDQCHEIRIMQWPLAGQKFTAEAERKGFEGFIPV